MTTIGLISDTHGLLRPEARVALRNVDRIIHAGDICNAEVLAALADIAPLTAVRGNNDRGAWAQAVPERALIEIDGMKLYVLHDLHELDIDPKAAGVKAVITGHSHRPLSKMENGVLYVNPGSAGPRRFRLPISLGFLEIEGGQLRARLQTLDVD
ncbi:metallophosphoesterase family protein [Noviherbaspirillum autotrophicum]|uniref:Phosphoesterase n=1 Tax=Noviherbaspirillum autotrophicum TaxID=709839 RepID=A0A0C1Y8E3_9BURK|nr:metallophosphoesterase family protein [Noviherbaspirillum autotrophicum]KIF83198.1 phosphodiesterase [Noviherbaspirillum autotrophicum]